jgi:hypothetical protein
MKSNLLNIVALICIVQISCKKDNPTPPPAPTSDYRSQYTGEFTLYCKSINLSHPSDTSGKIDSTVTNYTVDATVSFASSDSIKIISPVNNRTYPAITFTYSSGTKIQYGINADGSLVGNPYSSGGRFVSTDSIVYTSHESHISTTSIFMMQGKRK